MITALMETAPRTRISADATMPFGRKFQGNVALLTIKLNTCLQYFIKEFYHSIMHRTKCIF